MTIFVTKLLMLGGVIETKHIRKIKKKSRKAGGWGVGTKYQNGHNSKLTINDSIDHKFITTALKAYNFGDGIHFFFYKNQ